MASFSDVGGDEVAHAALIKGVPQSLAILASFLMANSISTDCLPLEHHWRVQRGLSRCCVRRNRSCANHLSMADDMVIGLVSDHPDGVGAFGKSTVTPR